MRAVNNIGGIRPYLVYCVAVLFPYMVISYKQHYFYVGVEMFNHILCKVIASALLPKFCYAKLILLVSDTINITTKIKPLYT